MKRTTKTILALLLSLCLLSTLLPVTALAAEGNDTAIPQTDGTQTAVTYLDENGNTQTASDCTLITAETEALNAGWYAASGDTTVTYKYGMDIIGDV